MIVRICHDEDTDFIRLCITETVRMRPVRQETVERLWPESFGHRGRETASVGFQGRAGCGGTGGQRISVPCACKTSVGKKGRDEDLPAIAGTCLGSPHRDGDRTCRFGLSVGRGLSGARPEYMPFSARPRPDDGDGNAGASGDCFRGRSSKFPSGFADSGREGVAPVCREKAVRGAAAFRRKVFCTGKTAFRTGGSRRMPVYSME